MEWLFEFIMDIAQFLDVALDLEDFWELRQSFSWGSSCLSALLNSAVLIGGLTACLYGPPSLHIEQQTFFAGEQSNAPSRHSSFHQSHSAIGYQSIEPLGLSCRTIS